MDENLTRKYNALTEYLSQFDSIAIAYSGGVDSTLLLKAAADALGCEKVVAVIANSQLLSAQDFNDALFFCNSISVRLEKYHYNPFEIEGFSFNPPERCYICKKKLLGGIISIAAQYGIKTVAEGSNVDDMRDYRPGLKAISELGVISPLKLCEFSKADVRAVSEDLRLPTYNKQSAACLASRFAYGEEITIKRLDMVGKAESFLQSLGFSQCRVRIHGEIARIETCDSEIMKAVHNRELICNELKRLGFSYITLDLKGYRTGSMNEVLK